MKTLILLAPLLVHEWGTITTLHEPGGAQVTGLNQIHQDEVLPDFVHRYEPEGAKASFGKRPAITGNPQVTMRLETPVVYVYPPEGTTELKPFDVKAELRGGLINEVYPKATTDFALDEQRFRSKMASGNWDGKTLENFIVGRAQWQGVKLAAAGAKVPETSYVPWTAPRSTKAPRLAANGEAEHYLFYRGVAHLEQVLSTRHARGELRIGSPTKLHLLKDKPLAVSKVWVARVEEAGKIAYRDLGAVTVENGKEKTVAAMKLKELGAADQKQAGELRAAMKTALTAEGLFADEAEAMLATWDAAYFKRPGTRVFYVVPRVWIDTYIPLTVSTEAKVSRAFIGRIDLQGG